MLGPHTSKTPLSFFLRQNAEEHAAGLPSLMMQAQQAVQSILSGDHPRKKPGSGEKFWQFRDYDHMDRPQDIDWRQSAKGDHIYVRQKEHQNVQNIVFWCAGGAHMDFASAPSLPEKGHTAKVITIALALLFTRAHEKISLLGGDFRPGRTDKTLQSLGENLVHQKTDLNDLHFLRFPKNSSLIMTGDFLEDTADIQTSFDSLFPQTSGGTIIQVLDPAELDLPWDGRAIFEDADIKERIDDIGSVRARYQERIQRHIGFVQEQCRDRGWHYILHRTDTDIRQTLFDLWMRLMPEKNQGGR